MRRPLVVANWKMNMTTPDAGRYAEDFLVNLSEKNLRAETVICPPFTAMETLAREVKGSDVQLGAQNFHSEPGGAYTGEISLAMLQALGCRYALVGHSERRRYFGEGAETIGEKVKAAVAAEIIPILCVGETMSERSLGMTEKIIGQQLLTCLKHLHSSELDRVVVAYEPLWAIGTGQTATAADAERLAIYVRERIERLLGGDMSRMRVLYGGSVTPASMPDFVQAKGVDGVLVGGASLDPHKFSAIAMAYGEA